MSRMWEPSPSPQESWSDAEGGNEDGEWPVKAIVGEEIRLDGTSRYGTHFDRQYISQRASTDTKYVPLIRQLPCANHTYLYCSRYVGEVGQLAPS